MNKKGFTLIELLVVVLIIGILAAIALPQYFRAVERSRSTEALSLIGSIAAAMERGRLVDPAAAWPTSPAELDVAFPDFTTQADAAAFPITTRNFNITFAAPNVVATRNDTGNAYVLRKNASTGAVCCVAGATTTCGSLGITACA